jgi:hypothetical protein
VRKGVRPSEFSHRATIEPILAVARSPSRAPHARACALAGALFGSSRPVNPPQPPTADTPQHRAYFRANHPAQLQCAAAASETGYAIEKERPIALLCNR